MKSKCCISIFIFKFYLKNVQLGSYTKMIHDFTYDNSRKINMIIHLKTNFIELIYLNAIFETFRIRELLIKKTSLIIYYIFKLCKIKNNFYF